MYIGIDPGQKGGIAFINKTKNKLVVVDVMVMPLAGKDIDTERIIHELKYYMLNVDLIACIEKVGAMPSQGVTSMFTFGFGTGLLHGILAGLSIPRHMVTPQAWKKVILAGTNKDKDAAIEYCRRAYPDVNLLATPRSKKCHSGIADAICIAEYAAKYL